MPTEKLNLLPPNQNCGNYKKLLSEKIKKSTYLNTNKDIWFDFKSCLLNNCKDTCGLTRSLQNRRDAWWQNTDVERVVKENRKLWKA